MNTRNKLNYVPDWGPFTSIDLNYVLDWGPFTSIDLNYVPDWGNYYSYKLALVFCLQTKLVPQN